MFDERYQTPLDGQEVVESHQILRLEELRTCYPLRSFVLRRAQRLFNSKTIAISKGAFACRFFGIPRAADLPGANNSQTTPGIVLPIVPDVVSLSLRGYAGEIVSSSIDFPLRKPIFFCLLQKNCYWRRQNALKFPHLAIEMVWLILSDDLTEEKLYFIETGSWEESIFPNKK